MTGRTLISIMLWILFSDVEYVLMTFCWTRSLMLLTTDIWECIWRSTWERSSRLSSELFPISTRNRPVILLTGGPTYCALASLALAARRHYSENDALDIPSLDEFISPEEKYLTIRWLLQKQKYGFQGRTGKSPDACYCFWCGAALKVSTMSTFAFLDFDTRPTE